MKGKERRPMYIYWFFLSPDRKWLLLYPVGLMVQFYIFSLASATQASVEGNSSSSANFFSAINNTHTAVTVPFSLQWSEEEFTWSHIPYFFNFDIWWRLLMHSQPIVKIENVAHTRIATLCRYKKISAMAALSSVIDYCLVAALVL